MGPGWSVVKRYGPQAQPTGPMRRIGEDDAASGAALCSFDSQLGRLVLRAWPGGPRDFDRLSQIHRWLDELRGVDVVPLPLRTADGDTLVTEAGRWWQVEPWKPGTSATGEGRRVDSAFGAIGRVHARWSRLRQRGPSPDLEQRARELESIGQGGLIPYARAVRHGSNGPIQDLAVRAIEQARTMGPTALEAVARYRGRVTDVQPCIRDTRPEHLLFEGDELTGLVDFGGVGVEHPAVDLARLLADWIGPDREGRSRALAAYASHGPDVEGLGEWLEAFEWSMAALGALRWIRWKWMDGREFRPGQVERGLSRCLARGETLRSLGGGISFI